MPNTIFKATKAEEEKKISLRVMLRKKTANADNRKEENGR